MTETETRSEVVQVRLTPSTKKQLQEVAALESRSISSMAAIAIELYLEEDEDDA